MLKAAIQKLVTELENTKSNKKLHTKIKRYLFNSFVSDIRILSNKFISDNGNMQQDCNNIETLCYALNQYNSNGNSKELFSKYYVINNNELEMYICKLIDDFIFKTSEKKYKMIKYHVFKYLIPVYVDWKENRFNNDMHTINYIKEFNDLGNKFNFRYDSYDLYETFWNRLISNSIWNNNEQSEILLNIVKRIYKDYKNRKTKNIFVK